MRRTLPCLQLTCRKRRASVAAQGPRGAVVASVQGRTEFPEGVGLRDGHWRGAGAGWRDGGDDVTLLGGSPPILTRLRRHVLQHKTWLLLPSCFPACLSPATASHSLLLTCPPFSALLPWVKLRTCCLLVSFPLDRLRLALYSRHSTFVFTAPPQPPRFNKDYLTFYIFRVWLAIPAAIFPSCDILLSPHLPTCLLLCPFLSLPPYLLFSLLISLRVTPATCSSLFLYLQLLVCFIPFSPAEAPIFFLFLFSLPISLPIYSFLPLLSSLPASYSLTPFLICTSLSVLSLLLSPTL